MKKKSWTKILVAAAVITVLAVTSIAGGRLLMINSSSNPFDNFDELPDAAWEEEKLGVSPTMTEEFSNGYEFESGGVWKNKLVTDGNSQGTKYNSLYLTYANGADQVTLELSGMELPHNPNADVETIEREDVKLYYVRRDYKFVPPDYEMTAQDREDEANGVYVFSVGSDEVEISDFQHLSWTDNGVSYSLSAYDSPLEKDDFLVMAAELMDAQ